GAVPVKVPLASHRYDLPALLEAVTERTKLVYVCTPNNPTGTMTTRAELDDYFGRVPEHVLTVADQAYFEYIDEPDYPDAIAEHFQAGRRVLITRTFSTIYGLAGLRVVYAETGEDGQVLFDALLREGVIVRPLAGIGAAEAIRVTVGTDEELAFFDEALGRVRASAVTW